jgi:FtsP/CotA-like multicopper oxidase with cupredoxin domain
MLATRRWTLSFLWLCALSAAAMLALVQTTQAQQEITPAAPVPSPLPAGLLDCKPLVSVPLPKIPEIISSGGFLRGTILLSDRQQRIAFRTPPGNVPGTTGNTYECHPQYVRYFTGLNTTPPTPIPAPNDYANPMPGPTLRARVGDIVQLTLLNQINPGNFGSSIDRAENGIGNGCDTSSGGNVPDNNNPGKTTPQAGYPQNAGDNFPDCFHGSSTGNLHFHGTHTNPNATGDNVLLELRPSPRAGGKPTVTEATFKKQFDAFFEACAAQLKGNVLNEWPKTWNDKPLGPPSDAKTYTGMQKALLQAYDKGRPVSQQFWPIDAMQYEEGIWPQYYIGAYPYCFVLPEYKAAEWPPAKQMVSHAGMNMMAPSADNGPVLQMGQSPGTHWYHAHKHGSTAINVANGMTGAFIIEGKYDDDLNAFYGKDWTRSQPVMVINQIGVSPNLLRLSPARTDKGPDFSVNGRLQPRIKMYPGEVQMWRIVNSSGRAGVHFVGPPASNPGATANNPDTDFQWKQIAQDGVQFADSSYQASLNKSFLMASGNRADILIKAPLKPGVKSFNVLVQNTVASSDILTPNPAKEANKVALVTIDIDGSGPEMQFIPKAPEQPPYLADITDAEIKGTKTVTFTTGSIGAPGQQTINGQPFSGEVGEVMLLNTAEEWKIQNASVKVSVDHPFHIHINPFQITELFDPNQPYIDPATNQPIVIPPPDPNPNKVQATFVPQYVFSADDKKYDGQCLLDANDPQSWKPCGKPFVTQNRIWWDVFPIPYGRTVNAFGRAIVVPGYFKMRSRFVDYPGLFVIHCHILAHEDRGMMMVVEVRPLKMPYAHH